VSEVRRIVVSRLRFLGDVVLTTPLLAALRHAFPQASLEYLTQDEFVPVLRGHPCVDLVHGIPARASWLDMVRTARALRSPRIDWWFDLFGNPRSAILTAASRPRHSVGPKRGVRSWLFQHRREGPRGNVSAVRHHMDNLVPLLGEVEPGPTALHVEESERAAVTGRLRLDAPRRLILLHPGSTWPDKAWPEENWPELVAGLRERGLGPFAVVSPPGESGLAERIARRSGADTRALDEISIREMMALVSCCRMLVSNDGGVLHCAVAQGTPTVGLFGPTDPDIWFPYQDLGPFRVLREYNAAGPCSRCGREHVSSLAHLPAARVVETVWQVLQESSKEATGA
jgi:ADP-heptose:LPS heptosyltransferase